jgi:hypothetical protein
VDCSADAGGSPPKDEAMNSREQSAPACGETYHKETLLRGVPTRISCLDIGGQTYSLSGGPVRTLGLEDDWYENVKDPAAVIEVLQGPDGPNADLFTFWQRPPDTGPAYDYHREFDEIAILPLSTYEAWWNETIKSRIRSAIRKSAKQGVEIRETVFDDAFVEGVVAIFNEARVRQGRTFWHFGKDFETVKKQFSRYVYRERMIGAYFQEQLIGFVMLGNAGRFSLLGQILSSLHHRDKSPNNCLIAKAVELAVKQGHEQLVYWYWSDDSLSEFKRRCGFQKIAAPRYYVPLSYKGRLALEVGAHRGFRSMVPLTIKHRLKDLRNRWHSARNHWT